MNSTSFFFAALGAAVTLLPPAHGDLITWSAPLDSTNTSDVSAHGVLVAALNLWGGTTFPVFVNGVTFIPAVPNEWDSGGSTLMSNSSTGDPDFDQLLTTARTPFGTPSGNPSGFGAIQLDTLGTLQIGKTYEVQVRYCDPLWLLVEGTHPQAGQSLRPHVNALQVREVIGATLGNRYCMAAQNSTGTAAVISGFGSAVASVNDFTLDASNLPTSSFGFFIGSRNQGFVVGPGGSAGNLCLAGSVGRYVGPGQIQNSGTTGSFSLQTDLTAIPTPVGPMAAVAGDTWNFQTWYRDSSPTGPTSNFSQGLEMIFL